MQLDEMNKLKTARARRSVTFERLINVQRPARATVCLHYLPS